MEYCCATLTKRLPAERGFNSRRRVTWMGLSACVPHAQAGRMNMDVIGVIQGRVVEKSTGRFSQGGEMKPIAALCIEVNCLFHLASEAKY